MRVLVAGDYCPYGRVLPILESGNYKAVFGGIRDDICDADYSIVNFECPVVERDAKPIDKCGPHLRCTSKAAEALKWVGFKGVTLANNHFLDYGAIGVEDTIEACVNNDLNYVGGGVDLTEASKVLYTTVKGSKLAIINCCEHEFSIATENTAGSNPYNTVNQFYAIKEGRENADFVLVIIHGGIEHFWLPNQRMIETYRFFVDVGADAVINHHQHCYSGYEVYRGKPIFYGLGNFCFDGIGSGDRWSSGYMVRLLFNAADDIKFQVLPYRQCDITPDVRLMKGEDRSLFFTRLNEYNDIISDNERLEKAYIDWCRQHEGLYKSVVNPLYNKITRFLYDGQLSKYVTNRKKLLHTLDAILNESHLERVQLLLKGMLKE